MNIAENFDFSFIGDSSYREILAADYSETVDCLHNDAYKSVIVLSGSIIESILSDYYFQSNPDTKIEKIYRMDLGTLIDFAVASGIIKERSQQLSNVIKNFRNLIHPGRLIRTKEKIDSNLAMAAFSVLNVILTDIRDSYTSQYELSAEGLYNTIKNDRSTIVNVKTYLSKLSKSEKNKLIDMIIDVLASEDSSNTEDLLLPINIYKEVSKNYKHDGIKIATDRLVREVHNGNWIGVKNLFRSFGTYLNLLDTDTKDDVLRYLYSKTSSFQLFEAEPYEFMYEGIYPKLGQYHYTDTEKGLYYSALISAVSEYNPTRKKSRNYLVFYKEFTESLDQDKRDKLKEYIKSKVKQKAFDQFYKGFDSSGNITVVDEDLPF